MRLLSLLARRNGCSCRHSNWTCEQRGTLFHHKLQLVLFTPQISEGALSLLVSEKGNEDHWCNGTTGQNLLSCFRVKPAPQFLTKAFQFSPAAASCAVTSSCTALPSKSLSSNVVLSGELGSSLIASDIIVLLMLIGPVVTIDAPSVFMIDITFVLRLLLPPSTSECASSTNAEKRRKQRHII